MREKSSCRNVGAIRAARIVRLEILWPGETDAPQTFANVRVNQAIEVTQAAADYTHVGRRRYRLGGTRGSAIP